MNYESGGFDQDGTLALPGGEGRRSRRWWIIGSVAIVAVLLLAFAFMHGKKEGAATAQAGSTEQLPTVSVIVPGRQTVERPINATGTLAARVDMPVGIAGEGGRVTAVLVQPGQWANAGQVLFCGIAGEERAARLGQTLMMPEMFSGWGVRTLSADAPRFNPMSYHNGSVWPHDNALIAMGLARYGLKRAASAIFEGLFDAAAHMEMMRFPELFCGFPRRRGTAPTLYAVACAPQAWASAAPFALLEACLGIACDHQRREIRFHNPMLPRFMEEVRIRNLSLDGASADLRLRRHGEGTEVPILAQRGDISIRIAQYPIDACLRGRHDPFVA